MFLVAVSYSYLITQYYINVCSIKTEQKTHFMALSPGQSGWAGTRSTSHSGFLWVPRRYCSPTHAVPILSSSPLTGTPADNITGMAHWRWPDNNDLTSHDYLPDAVPVTTLPNNSSLDWHHSILVIHPKALVKPRQTEVHIYNILKAGLKRSVQQ